jgi:hypothetical protein
MDQPQPQRRPLQFGLRTLLVLVFSAAVAAWWSRHFGEWGWFWFGAAWGGFAGSRELMRAMLGGAIGGVLALAAYQHGELHVCGGAFAGGIIGGCVWLLLYGQPRRRIMR